MSPQPPVDPAKHHRWISHNAGILAGLIGALAAYSLVPDSFTGPVGEPIQLGHPAKVIAAAATMMAIWWTTEAIPVFATALIPVCLFPIGGAMTFKQAATPYSHDLIFLFLGGFVLALSMQACGLHRRIALVVLRRVGTKSSRLIGGFMLISAVLSMWVSNTATAMMMMPIGLSLIDLAESGAGENRNGSRQFSTCLLLAIAYAASIGGLGTLIGSPPNGFVASFFNEQYNHSIGFVDWMKFGVPVVAVLLPLTWWTLVKVLFRGIPARIAGGQQLIETEWQRLGPMQQAEWIVMITFFLTAAGWLLRPSLAAMEWSGRLPLAGLSDAGIAIAAALVLFLAPRQGINGRRVMEWTQMQQLPWGLLILFGGGLSLATAIEQTGLSNWIGSGVSQLAGYPEWVIVLAVIALVIFLTEITSNTATVATLVPILAAIATGMDLSPWILIAPAALAGSCAFMLPVATPPNAIVFGTDRITIGQMARAGLLINLISIFVLLAAALWILPPLQ